MNLPQHLGRRTLAGTEDRVGAVADPVREEDLPPAIPAATVVLLRDGADGVETLMLRRDSKLAFAGGAWVFPGGRIDPEDYPDGVAAFIGGVYVASQLRQRRHPKGLYKALHGLYQKVALARAKAA